MLRQTASFLVLGGWCGRVLGPGQQRAQRMAQRIWHGGASSLIVSGSSSASPCTTIASARASARPPPSPASRGNAWGSAGTLSSIFAPPALELVRGVAKGAPSVAWASFLAGVDGRDAGVLMRAGSVERAGAIAFVLGVPYRPSAGGFRGGAVAVGRAGLAKARVPFGFCGVVVRDWFPLRALGSLEGALGLFGGAFGFVGAAVAGAVTSANEKVGAFFCR